MKTLHQLSAFARIRRPVFLAAGFFDGVHIGHRLVIDSAVSRARESHGEAWVLTFDRHPLSVLAPSKAPPLLYPLEGRLRQLADAGVDGALVLPFSRRLALQEPEDFVRALCGGSRPDPDAIPSEIRCGANWRFGRRAAGTPELLSRLGSKYGFTVVILPYAYYKEKEVSSTRIRESIQEGRLEEATAMLGRPFSIRGSVQHGRGVGESALSVATANLDPAAFPVLPPRGVYASCVRLADGTRFRAVTDYGIHPTFGDASAKPMLETHLLDFRGDLYNQTLELFFLSRLRDEHTFPSLSSLKAQIATDIALVSSFRL